MPTTIDPMLANRANPIDLNGSIGGGGNAARSTKYKVTKTDNVIEDDLFNRLFEYVADVKIKKTKATRKRLPSTKRRNRTSKRTKR